MKKITVLIPTYNRANFICSTIESILAQSFSEFECLILDDGSTDNTREVIQSFLTDSRIQYFYHENRGEAETVNRGWQMATGEYFTQVNSDDPVYPDFLEAMIHALDANPDKILAYPDFDFIDEQGKVLQTTHGRAWDFLRNLAAYSCEAACPGTMFRRSALSDITQLKRKGFLHINDTEMYWNLALRGDFLHVPKVLTTWRQHQQQISAKRYKCISECEQWFRTYFSQKSLPAAVKDIEQQTRKSLCRYFISLLEQADLLPAEKRQLLRPYQQELGQPTYEFSCLQVGDQDLIGGKFNGHMLHIGLREKNIDAYHYVCKKESEDEYTFLLNNSDQKSLFDSLVFNKIFAASDIIHLHLIHNTQFDLSHLPFLSRLKPVIWTLHDPFALNGHCIYHGTCDKWKSQCMDCNHLETPFLRQEDTSCLEFALKKNAIAQSNMQAIVASKWMYDKVKASSIWQNKPVHLVPFGVDHNIFAPGDTQSARREMGLPADAIVLFARTQRYFKGLDILKESLDRLATHNNIVLLTVGQNGLLPNLPPSIFHKEYGWVTDDKKLAMLYQACDIFLMPSEQEAFGMMAIEAMSCGKMVLALDVVTSALPSVINAPHCGLAVDRTTYPHELLRLIAHPQEILQRGTDSLEYARKNYNFIVYLNNLIEVYKNTIETFTYSEESKNVLFQIQKYAPYSPHKPEASKASMSNYSYRKLINFYQKHGALQTSLKIKEKIKQVLISHFS